MDGLHIHSPEIKDRRQKELDERYCFRCRKRHKFILDMFFQDWYGWSAQVKCSGCGAVDGDCGFGTERIWEE